MADDIQRARLAEPVYKLQSTPGNEGVLAEAGDTIVVQLVGLTSAGVRPTQNLVLHSVSENGYEIAWEYDAANQYLTADRLHGIAPGYQFVCPVAGNIELTGPTDVDGTITSFSVNGEVHTETYLITEEGAAALEEDLQAELDAQGVAGSATVTFVDNGGSDYFKVYVTNTTAEVIITPGGTLA